jgi:hypothetical protein
MEGKASNTNLVGLLQEKGACPSLTMGCEGLVKPKEGALCGITERRLVDLHFRAGSTKIHISYLQTYPNGQQHQ